MGRRRFHPRKSIVASLRAPSHGTTMGYVSGPFRTEEQNPEPEVHRQILLQKRPSTTRPRMIVRWRLTWVFARLPHEFIRVVVTSLRLRLRTGSRRLARGRVRVWRRRGRPSEPRGIATF